MKAKLVNEKFTEGGDPIHDLGIGMGYQRRPISKKEYEEEPFTRIENINILREVLYNFITIKKLNIIIYNIRLLGNNKQLFLDKFEKQDFVWTDEYKQYAWGFKFPNGRLLVFTGNKGTSFEYEGYAQERDAKALAKFFKFIIENK